MGKKRKPIQYVKTSKTGAAAYDPNTGQYLPQQYLPTVEITADRALPFQNGKFAPWLAAKGIAEYVPIESALLPATPYIRGLGKFGNFALDAANPLAGDGLLSKEGIREFIKQGADKASEASLKDFMIKAKAAFNKGPEGKFGTYADIKRDQIERGRLAELMGMEDNPDYWNQIRTPEYPIDRFNTKSIANNGMDNYIRGDVSPLPSVSNRWLTQADPGDVVREMGRTSYAKDIPESDQYLAWQNWERYKSMITDPRNAQLLPIHEMRNKIVQNMDSEKVKDLNSNIRRMPLGMAPETLNSTMSSRSSLPSGSYSTGAGNTFSTGNLGPNSFVTNADVPSTPTGSQYNMLPNFMYDFRKPPSTQIDISKELGKGSYSATGINPSPLVNDPNFLLKGSRSGKVQNSFMTNAEAAYNSPDFAKEYVQAYDAYRKGYDIAPIVGAKVPDNPNDMMLELMPRIQGQNLFSTRLQTPSGRTIRITDKDAAYKRLASADVKRFGEQTHQLDKDFYFDPIGDNIMLGNDNRLYHIDMFPKLSNFKTRLLGQDPAPIMNSYKGSVLEKITSGLPSYEAVQRDVDKGFITKSMADKMLENSMRIGNDFVEGAKLGQSDIDFNIDSNSLYAYGLNGLKRFGGGGNLNPKLNKMAIPKMYTGGGMEYFANRQQAMQQGDAMGNSVASIFPIAGAFKALGQGASNAIAPKDQYGVSSRGDFAVGLAGGIDPLESTTSAFNDIQGGKFDSTTAWNLAFPPVGAVMQNRKNKEMRDQMLGSLQSKTAPSMSAGFTNTPSMFATGGPISNRTPNSFIQYNGPGHENGGIPVTADGIPAPRHMADAEVEGGETSYKSYVYSDRLKDPKTGKTFADLSKAISKRYGDTSDPISARGFEMEMSRLMASNEEIRIKKEMNSYKRKLKSYLPEKAWGGLTKDQWTQAGIQNAGNIANLAYNIFSKPAKYPFYNNPYAGQIAGNPQLLDPTSELARANDTYTGLKRSLPGMTGGQSAGLGALRLMAARQRDTGNSAIYDRYNQANVGIRENRMNRLLQMGEYDRQARQWSFDNTQRGKANKDNQIFADVNAIGANVGNMYNQAAWNKMLEDPRKSWMEWQYSQNTAQDPAGNMVSVRPGYQGALDGPSFIGGNYPVNTPYTGAPKFNPNLGIPTAPKAPAYYPPYEYEDNLAPWQLSGPRMRKGGMLYAY